MLIDLKTSECDSLVSKMLVLSTQNEILSNENRQLSDRIVEMEQNYMVARAAVAARQQSELVFQQENAGLNERLIQKEVLIEVFILLTLARNLAKPL